MRKTLITIMLVLTMMIGFTAVAPPVSAHAAYRCGQTTSSHNSWLNTHIITKVADTPWGAFYKYTVHTWKGTTETTYFWGNVCRYGDWVVR